MNKKVVASLRNVFDGIMIFMLFVGTTVYALPSNGVTYDNSSSGSSATNVRDAIDDLYSQLSVGNASSNTILSGYTALVQGSTVEGSIPSKGATTYTPGTQNQTIASNQYLSGNQTIKGDANLVPQNIAKGKSIFGVSGTYTSDANAVAANILSSKTAYVNGSKITGTMANNAGKQVSVTNTSSDASYTYLNIPSSGYYDTNSKLKVESSKINRMLTSTFTLNAGNTSFDLENIKSYTTLKIKITDVFDWANLTLYVYGDDTIIADLNDFNEHTYNISSYNKIKMIGHYRGGNGDYSKISGVASIY